jgi:DNA-binding transcriptional ArsR family regulator
MTEDARDVAVTTPEQFKALGHPMRHRLLFALGRDEATISQLAATLGSNKGNISHHLRVLVGDDAATTEAALRALAAEIAAAEPGPFMMLRGLRLSPEHAQQLTATLRDLGEQADDGGDHPRYGLLLGLYQPAQPEAGDQPPPADGSRIPAGPPGSGSPA